MRPTALPSPSPPTLATLWCFGSGTNGQLATGRLQDSHTALQLHLEHPSSIAASFDSDSEVLPAVRTCSSNHTTAATGAADADASGRRGQPPRGGPPTAPAAVGEEEGVKVTCGGNHVVVWWAPRTGFASNLAGKVLQGDSALPYLGSFVGWTWGLDVAGCGEGRGEQARRPQDQDRMRAAAVRSSQQSVKPAPKGRLGQATADDTFLPAQDVGDGALHCATAALETTHTATAPAPAGCVGALAKAMVAGAACDGATAAAGGVAATSAAALPGRVPMAGGELVVEAAAGCGVLDSPRRVALPPSAVVYGSVAGGPLAAAAAAPWIQQVACGWEHTVFLTASGEVLVAGRGGRGQLGLGPDATAATRPRPLPLPPPLLPTGWRVNSVAAGMWHTLVAATAPFTGIAPCTAPAPCTANVDAAATAKATAIPAAADMQEWADAVAAAAATVAGAADVSAPSAPAEAAVAAVYGFGSNRRLQLGDLGVGSGGDVGRHAAVAANAAADASTAVAAAVASSGAMDVVTSCTVYGSSGAANLGRPAARVSASSSSLSRCACVWYPALVHLEKHRSAAPLQVYAGGDHSAFLDAGGRLFVWGRALSGFADAPGVPATTPQPGAPHGSARRAFSRPRDCGAPTQVMVPPLRPARPGAAAGEVSTVADATAVASAGAAPIAALSGDVTAAQQAQPAVPAATRDGSPAAGPCSLGRGSGVMATSAQSEARVWRQVALGWHHAVGLDSAGQVWAWGSNRNGQLARLPPAPSTRPEGRTPPVSNPQPQVAAAAVPDRALQAAEAEVVVESPVPLAVPLPAAAICVAAGSEHCAAVLQEGCVFTWGWGEHGQLGQGDEESRWVPERVVLPPVGHGAGYGAGLGAAACPVAVACSSVACGSGFTVCVQRPR